MCSCTVIAGIQTSWFLPRSQTHPSCPFVTVPHRPTHPCTFTFSLLVSQTTKGTEQKNKEAAPPCTSCKENKSQPLSHQLRRGNALFSFSSNASPASTHLLTIHHWVKAVPSSRDKLSNSPPSQLCISLIISLVVSWGSGEGSWPQKILCKPTCTMAVMYCWKCSFVFGRKSCLLKVLTPDFSANNAAPSARNVPMPVLWGETELWHSELAEETSKETESWSVKEFEQRARVGQNAFRVIKTPHRLWFQLGKHNFSVF